MAISRPSFAIVVALCTVALAESVQSADPPPRAHHALVYDEAREAVLLTSGSAPIDGGERFQFFNDLWALNESGWKLLGESGDGLSGIGLAYDPRRHRVVSIGGFNGSPLGDLRILEDDQWQPRGLAALAVGEPGFVYDTKRNRFVAFGGSTGPDSLVGNTWEYDGSRWTRVEGAGPPPRQAHGMVFDQRRGRTVVFGGRGPATQDGQPRSLADTWEYDGKTWTRREGPAPSRRQSAGIAYDSKRGVVILFGGHGGADGFLGDTWSWDGTTWKKLSETGPEPRAMGYLAYDKRRDRVVLFGGRKGWPNGDLNDTWEWDGATWQRFGG